MCNWSWVYILKTKLLHVYDDYANDGHVPKFSPGRRTQNDIVERNTIRIDQRDDALQVPPKYYRILSLQRSGSIMKHTRMTDIWQVPFNTPPLVSSVKNLTRALAFFKPALEKHTSVVTK